MFRTLVANASKEFNNLSFKYIHIMNKTQAFIVEIYTDSPIYLDEDIKEMANNIALAIAKEARNNDIAPENGDKCTEIVYVRPWYLNEHQAIEHI